MYKKILKKATFALLIIGFLGLIILLTINFYVKKSTESQIISVEAAQDIKDIDCILVLGAGIRNDKPSPMLEDRLITSIKLYNLGVSQKILVSGDHGQENYDEVNVMKNYVKNEGIPSSDIFMDHAGFSTYDSIYRAKSVFQAKKIIIVTQEYHLYRALYIAKKLGLEAYGVSATLKNYGNQEAREVREILARDKDFVKCVYKPEPTYLGEAIPIFKDGDITNDK